MKKIIDITPCYRGYESYPCNDAGKTLLPRAEDGYIIIYRKNTLDYGNGLIGICDGSKIAESEWVDLRKGFWLVEKTNERNFHWCVGGSDSGAVLGVSKYSDSEKIYDTKKSLAQEEISAVNQYRFDYGHINEELIAQGFAELTKLDVVKNNTVFFNLNTGFMQANVDFFVRHNDGRLSVLEIKTTNSNNDDVIEDYKRNIVPNYYYTQAVLHYPMCLGDSFNIKGTYFAIAYNNSLKDIITCHFDRDKNQEVVLYEAEKEFVSCLRNNIRPEQDKIMVDNSSVLKSIQEKYPVAAERSVSLSSTAINAVKSYIEIDDEISELNKQIKKLEDSKNLYKAMICEEMADAEISESFELNGKQYSISYKNGVRENINKTILKNKYDEIFKECVSYSHYRTLRVTKLKSKKKAKVNVS